MKNENRLIIDPQEPLSPREAALYAALQEAQAAAKAAIQLRDSFFSIAAHELRTPLTALFGQAQLLQRRMATDIQQSPQNLRSVEVIANQARRLNQLLNALLDVSRIEYGHLRIDHQALNVWQIVQQVAEEMEPLVLPHTISLASAPPELPVIGDPLRLEQVFENILNNAIRYGAPTSVIDVQATQHEGQVGIAVIDHGIGIPQDALPHIFSRFYRAPNAISYHVSGLGLGLFVSQEIVNLHGGSIAVETEVDVGSRFTVWLPMARPQPVHEPSTISPTMSQGD